MKHWLSLLALGWTCSVAADYIPVRAVEYSPIILQAQCAVWPELYSNKLMFGQIEQETCVSLKHSKCFNSKAELKTSREYGFGLGQISITEKFNNFEEAKKYDDVLRNWKWEDRYNPSMQVRTMAWHNKKYWLRLNFIKDETERTNLTYASYNGGLGSVLASRQRCKSILNCNPDAWYPVLGGKLGVANVSNKSKQVVGGYGKSFFQINYEYPGLVAKRAVKYASLAKPCDSIELE